MTFKPGDRVICSHCLNEDWHAVTATFQERWGSTAFILVDPEHSHVWEGVAQVLVSSIRHFSPFLKSVHDYINQELSS